jgi:phenylpropionate dioxygenase-like ring-hydroxylating dioxygenase large terminal subunit
MRTEFRDMFINNSWYVAAWADDVRDKPVARTILGRRLVLFRSSKGIAALEDLCPHRFVPLSLGTVVDDSLQCAYHGLRFDRAGACIEAPGQDLVPRAACVRSYPTVERWRWLWVWMGAPELADPSTVPEYPWLSDPKWVAVTGQFEIDAGYELLLDNLHNHTHLQFVHRKTIGTDKIVSASQEVKRVGNQVHVTRWLLKQQPPKLFAHAGGFSGLVDRWFNSVYLPPSGVVLDIGCAEADSGAREGDRTRGIEIRSLHAITPVDARRCSYYWAYVRSFKPDDQQLTGMLKAGASATFEEDVAILEAQQREINGTGARPYAVHLAADAGGIQVKRILGELMRAEEQPAQTTAVA